MSDTGRCSTLKAEFNLKYFSLDYSEPEQFVHCQWQKTTTISVPYLAYRWVLAAYFCASMGPCFAEAGNQKMSLSRASKWAIYMTNWSYLLDAIQAIVATYLITHAIIRENRGEQLKCKMCPIVKVYWILHSTAVVLATGVAVSYWAGIHDYSDSTVYVLSLMSHGLNSVLMITDLFLASHPFRLLHFYWPVTVTIIFIFFSLVYFEAGGLDRSENPYIYSALDWNKPLTSIGAAVIGIIFVVTVHVIMWLLYLLRQRLFVVCNKKNDIENG